MRPVQLRWLSARSIGLCSHQIIPESHTAIAYSTDPNHTPPFPSLHPMAPYLLGHPVFDVVETPARVPDSKVVDPPTQHGIDQLNPPRYRLRAILSEHLSDGP